MNVSYDKLHYYNALHDVFSVDYHEVNQYVLDLYLRPKQFIAETGPPLDRFLREYTLPGVPRCVELPTGAVLEFISQIDEFTSQTVGLFDEHKAYVDQCDQYMRKVSGLRRNAKNTDEDEVLPELTKLTPELISVYEGLKKIKEKADSMAVRLEKLEARWSAMKEAINR